jgi:CubicO group peptidase (beta-lactamase class C family)
MKRFSSLAPILVLAAAAFSALPACSDPAGSQAGGGPVDTRGLDASTMAEVSDRAARLPRLHALIVARHGEILFERRFSGPALDQPVNIKSASKTLLSALTGIAIDRGMIKGTEQKIAPILGGDLPPNPDPRLHEIDVGDLLSMRAGLGPTSGPHYGAWVSSPNWVRFALARPFEDEPGGRMIYSTGSSHLLSAVLTRASGRSTLDLARDWLAEPLDIALPAWPQDPQGIYFGGNEMLLSPRALLRFGELYRRGGELDGRRILSQRWIEESWRPRGVSPWSGNGYGYGWFAKESRGHQVRFAWGYGGQMLFIVPDLALTVVMISDPAPHPRADGHIPELHRLLDTGILPAALNGAG